MRQKLFNLFAVLFVIVSVCSSCSDDNKENVRPDATFENQSLKLSMNGTAMENRSVAVKFTSNTDAQITLNQVILGSNEATMPVKLVKTNAGSTITGEATMGETQVSVTGDLTNADVLTLNVATKNTSKAVGKWYLQYQNGDWDVVPSLLVNLNTPKEKVILFGMEQDPKLLPNFFNLILGGYVKALDWIEFKENGNVALQFDLDSNTPDVVFPDGNIVKEGDIKFFTREGKIYLAVSEKLIGSLLPGSKAIDPSKLPVEMTAGYIAIPMLFNNENMNPEGALEQGKTLNIFADKAMMQPMMPILTELVPEDMVVVFPIKPIMQEMTVIIDECNSFEIGLILAQQEAPAAK